MNLELIEILAASGVLESIGDFFSGIFSATWDFLKSLGDTIVDFLRGLKKGFLWFTIILLIVAGFVGTIVPFLPGTTLILAGCCLHFFALGKSESGLSWVTLAILTLLFVASVIVDSFSGAIGAKWFGSSRWGIAGAILGGIVGMFFSLPGIIIGPIAGVFIFEVIFGKKAARDAGSSTLGTVVGGGAGIILRAAIGFLMIVIYVLDLWLWK